MVTLGKSLGNVADLGYRWRVYLMNMKRRIERLGDPVAGGGGFVVVVQVLTRDAAEGVDLLYVSFQHP